MPLSPPDEPKAPETKIPEAKVPGPQVLATVDASVRHVRQDGRLAAQLRPISVATGFQRSTAGSALIRWGQTSVLCAASVSETVPPHRNDGGGWLTAEYAMLPGSTDVRKPRRAGGREAEIQRLIGRSLRAAIDLQALGPRTITVDCDVLQADGGTRVAAVTGGFIALALAVEHLRQTVSLAVHPIRHRIAAVSAGIIDGQAVLDLPYAEDRVAAVDMNVVMTGQGHLIEVQGTAEQAPFSRRQLDELCDLAWLGIERLCGLQERTIAQATRAPGTTVELDA